jgi:hypothetical protein
MKLAKRILFEGFTAPENSKVAEYLEQFNDPFSFLPRVTWIQGVHKKHNPFKGGEQDATTNVPFQRYWWEWPATIEVQKAGRSNQLVEGYAGFLTFVFPAGHRLMPKIEQSIDAHSQCISYGVFAVPGVRPQLVGFTCWGVGSNGRIFAPVDHEYLNGHAIFDELVTQHYILGIKNIVLEDQKIEDRSLTKRLLKMRGSGQAVYKTLVVQKPGTQYKGSPGLPLGAMPFHGVRGHVRDYGPKYGKGLLFGKYEGRFLIPPHTRGDEANGVVDKDYEVRGE